MTREQHLCSLMFVCVRLCRPHNYSNGADSFQYHGVRLKDRSVFPPGRVSSPGMTPVPRLVKEIIAFMKPAASTPWPQEPSIFFCILSQINLSNIYPTS